MPTTSDRTLIVDLLRHGEPEGGQRYRGHLDDPLSATGWAQMRAAVAGDTWDRILTSPLTRCRAFAETLGGELDIPVAVEPAFREISFGRWEGLTAAEILEQDGDHLGRFWADGDAHPPPEGERLGAFHQRVGDGWHRRCRELMGNHVLVVGHGGLIRMILAHVLNVPPNRTMAGVAIPYACRSRVRLDDTDHGLLGCLQSHGPRP